MVMNTMDKNSLGMDMFSKPIFSLMEMVARNNAKSKYFAIEENFLLAAIHLAATKDIPFAEGSLQIFLVICLWYHLGESSFLLYNSWKMLIQVVDIKIKLLMISLSQNMKSLLKNVE